MRPKTAERSSQNYMPTRAQKELSPKMANPGMNFSPYQVPNVAKLPANPALSAKSSKQVSFAGGRA